MATFIERIEKSLQRTFLPGPLCDQLIKMLVWEGRTGDHKLACTVLKDHPMTTWMVANKDVGSTFHQARAMASALQTALSEDMNALVFNRPP